MALATNSQIFLPTSKLGFFDDLKVFKEIYGFKDKRASRDFQKETPENIRFEIEWEFLLV